MIFKPQGKATGIGSLPFTDTGQALTLIKENLPEIPHWPQLPQRGKQEHFINQFLYPLVKYGLLCSDGDKIFFNTSASNWTDGLTEFYSHYLAGEEGDKLALEEFALPHEAAAGYYAFLAGMENIPEKAVAVKGHVVGPLTASFQVKDERGRLAYYDGQLRDLIVKTTALHAAWQTEQLQRYGLPVIIFVDDPALGVYGNSTYITVTREMVAEDLEAVVSAIQNKGGLAGVHCCDGVDWSILFESGLDYVSFDAYTYFNSILPYVSSLKEYIQRGGSLAWGLIPTLSDQAWAEDEDSLLRKLEDYWSQLVERGVPANLLLEHCLITPACGTGLLRPELAERIYKLTGRVSQRLRVREV